MRQPHGENPPAAAALERGSLVGVCRPDLGTAVNFLWGVTALSGSAAWAVGEHYLANGYTRATLILRWNGKK
ncbi:MAG TPA: hypothetical protein VHJ18_22875 [Streptosporangiaceae bacterium]|nr:hypothetical protein [Streptosporangiaceae bacterium]